MRDINDEILSLLGELGEVHDHLIAEADYCLQMLSGFQEEYDECGPIRQDDASAIMVCKLARQESRKLRAAYATYASCADDMDQASQPDQALAVPA